MLLIMIYGKGRHNIMWKEYILIRHISRSRQGAHNHYIILCAPGGTWSIGLGCDGPISVPLPPTHDQFFIGATNLNSMKLLCLMIIAICLVSSLEDIPGPIFENKPLINFFSKFEQVLLAFHHCQKKENFKQSTQHQQRYSIRPQLVYS